MENVANVQKTVMEMEPLVMPPIPLEPTPVFKWCQDTLEMIWIIIVPNVEIPQAFI